MWINLTSELEKTYFYNKNMQFNGFLLEKLEKEKNEYIATTDYSKIKQNKLKLSEKFSIEKFSKSTTNVTQWLDTLKENNSYNKNTSIDNKL